MKKNILLEKSFAFALRVINAYKYLTLEKSEYVMSRQFLQCGTDIGAHVEEATGGFSRTDFLYEMTNAYKKAKKTQYWIRLLQKSEFFGEAQAKSLLKDVEELLKIISKIQVTTRQTDNNS